MTRPVRIGLGLVASLAGVWLLWSVVQALYAGPRAELQTRLDKTIARVDAYRNALDDLPRVDAELQSFVDRTLGGSVEAVDHRLRTRLNRIAEAVALRGATVGTGNASTQRSPARAAFPRSGTWRAMRDEADFVELDGWVAGEAGLNAVVELVDRIDAEPWLKRINHVKIDPKGNGDRFAVTVRLTTLFLPGRGPVEEIASDYDRGRLARYDAIIEGNPFRVPPPVAAPVVVQAAPAPPRTPAPVERFPWEEWAVTGVADGPAGPEVWLRRASSGEARMLAVGERFEKAELIRAAGEWAEFQLGAERFRIQVGRTLNERSVVKE